MSKGVALVEEVNPEVTFQGLDLRTAASVIDELRAGGVLDTTGTSLRLDPDLPYEKYEALGAALGLINRSCAWWIGDWLLFGEGAYRERFAQAIEATGLAEQTLLNRLWVCRSVPPSRREPSLSFSTHALVASMAGKDQKTWLKRAAQGGWTRAVLEDRLRHDQREEPAERPQLPPGGVDTPGLVEAVRSLVRNADVMLDTSENVIVRREDFVLVKAALGEED